jgi:hypothetical protein
MADLKIEIDPKDKREVKELLASIPNGAAKALLAAVNKTAPTGKSMIAQKLGHEIGTGKTAILRHTFVNKATQGHPTATIKVKSRPINLIYFYAKKTATGIVAKLAGQAKQFPHDFISPGLSGNRLVFERFGAKRKMTKGRYTGKMRQPLQAVPGMSAQELYVKTPGVAQEVYAELGTVLEKNVRSQVDRLLNRKRAE